jgi:hypothetical protein
MTTKNPAAPGFKEKAKRELKEYAMISAYLAFFFCALVAYSAQLLQKYDITYVNYSLAIINALIIGKVILIGKMINLGKRTEARPLYQSVLLKSILFGLLVFVFHFLEEFVKRLIHGEPSGTVLHNIHADELFGRSIIIFCAFLPLFAVRELGRVMGEEKLHALFFNPAPTNDPSLSTQA